MENNMRPCWIPFYDPVSKEIRECRGLFHRFVDVRYGNRVETKALVEMPDTRIIKICPDAVRFADSRKEFDKYKWNGEPKVFYSKPIARKVIRERYVIPNWHDDYGHLDDMLAYKCPNCRANLGSYEYSINVINGTMYGCEKCPECGCFLDWSECKEKEIDD